MKYVLCLVVFCLFGCSVHRDAVRSLDATQTDHIGLDAVDVRSKNGVLENFRLFRGEYVIRGNWKIFDTSASQLPDGSFPLLAEGCTEEQGDIAESEQTNEIIHAQDSSALSMDRNKRENIQETVTTKFGSKTGINWFKVLLFGIVVGVIYLKYGKKN